MPLDGVFLVVAAETASIGSDPLARVEPRLAALEVASAWRLRPGVEIGLISCGRDERIAPALAVVTDLAEHPGRRQPRVRHLGRRPERTAPGPDRAGRPGLDGGHGPAVRRHPPGRADRGGPRVLGEDRARRARAGARPARRGARHLARHPRRLAGRARLGQRDRPRRSTSTRTPSGTGCGASSSTPAARSTTLALSPNSPSRCRRCDCSPTGCSPTGWVSSRRRACRSRRRPGQAR